MKLERRAWISLALVALTAAVLGLYYWAHKPVTPAQALALASALGDLGVALLLAVLGGALGRRVIGGWPGLAAGERLLAQAALGWGLLALVMLGLGLFGLYRAGLAWILAIGALVMLRREALGWLGDILVALSDVSPSDRLGGLARAFTVVMLGLGLLQALAPPLKWDALVYHLTLPKLYAQAHGLHLDQDIPFSGMPHLTEMLYTLAALLKSVGAAQALGWIFGALLALGLAAHTAEVLGRRTAWLAPAVLFASFTLTLSLAWAYVDQLVMLNALAGLIALRRWRLTGAGAWLALAGLLAGLAVAGKYTGAVVIVGGAALILSSGSGVRRLRSVLLFGLAAALCLLPWLLKNWAFTGSPLYPLLLPTAQMDALRQWFYNRPDTIDRSALQALIIFFRAVFAGVQGGNAYDATLTPLLVALPLALAVGWRRLAPSERDELGPLVIFGLAGYAAWVMTIPLSSFAVQPRLYFGLFPALAVLCAAGVKAAAALDSEQLRLSVILNAVLVFTLALSALESGGDFAARNPLPVLLGRQSADDYRAAQLGWYAPALERINQLPAGSRVQFLWEARSLECIPDGRCRPDSIIDRWWYWRRTLGPAGAILTHLQAQGATHLLVYDAGLRFVQADPLSPFTPDDWLALASLRGQLRLLEDFGGAYSLYALP